MYQTLNLIFKGKIIRKTKTKFVEGRRGGEGRINSKFSIMVARSNLVDIKNISPKVDVKLLVVFLTLYFIMQVIKHENFN